MKRPASFLVVAASLAALPAALFAQGSSTSFVRTPDGPRELKFVYDGTQVGDGGVLMLTGTGEYSFLGDTGMKVLFSGTVAAVSAGIISVQSSEATQDFAIGPETRLCRDGHSGVAADSFAVGDPATVQTSVEAPGTAELVAAGYLAVDPMGGFGPPPIAVCD